MRTRAEAIMIRNRRTRRGVSLTEVLVALFIMALGMIALLTLFPLGAMQIGQALKDDRTAQTADQADGYLRMYWRTVHAERIANGGQPGDPFVWAFDDPNLLNQVPTTSPGVSLSTYLPAYRIMPPPPSPPFPQTPPLPISPTSLIADKWVNPPPAGLTAVTDPSFYVNPGKRTPNGPSYAVLVDPLGVLARQGGQPDQFWVTPPGTQLVIPRRSLFPAPQPAPPMLPVPMNNILAFQTCVLTDDMTYGTNGESQLSRQGRYTWAALLQRPRNEDPATATMTVMVFDGRPPLLAAPGDEAVVTPDVPFGVGDRSLTITIPARSPDQAALVRRGGWILDGTIFNFTTTGGIRNAQFYRIVGVTEIGTTATGGTQYTIDLETPIQGPVPPVAAPGAVPPSQFYLFAGLSEVFQRPVLQPDASYQP
jgi:hypothetical protein